MEIKTLKEELHHRQLQLCKTRPAYRQGRRLTAVRSYTINNESQHLFIYGVPQVNLRSELKLLCRKYGDVLSIHVVSEYKTEAFTECYHVRYGRIQSARIAKRLLDNRSFYGGVLHVCYAPEYENVTETRTKLMQRCKDVLSRVGYGVTYPHSQRGFKRKRDNECEKYNEDTAYDINSSDQDLPEEFEVNASKITKKLKDDKEDYTKVETQELKSKSNDTKCIKLLPLPILRANSNKSVLVNTCKRIVFRNKDSGNYV